MEVARSGLWAPANDFYISAYSFLIIAPRRLQDNICRDREREMQEIHRVYIQVPKKYCGDAEIEKTEERG